jgi:hypothetical protein
MFSWQIVRDLACENASKEVNKASNKIIDATYDYIVKYDNVFVLQLRYNEVLANALTFGDLIWLEEHYTDELLDKATIAYISVKMAGMMLDKAKLELQTVETTRKCADNELKYAVHNACTLTRRTNAMWKAEWCLNNPDAPVEHARPAALGKKGRKPAKGRKPMKTTKGRKPMKTMKTMKDNLCESTM